MRKFENPHQGLLPSPVNRAVDKLLRDSDAVVPAALLAGNGVDSLAEQAVSDREHVGFVDDGQVLERTRSVTLPSVL